MDMPINNAKGFNAAIRTSHWWQYKAAPLMGFVYIFIHTGRLGFNVALMGITMSVITILGIAGIGYVINDLYDIEFDKAAGKTNRIGALSAIQRSGLISVLLLAAFLPWTWLPFNILSIILISFQFLLYFLYSHPAIRFKEKHFYGIVCDALYGHAIPAIIAIYTFYQLGNQIYRPSDTFDYFGVFLLLTFVWLFTKGLRNIITHQIEDRKNDRIVHLSTFVITYGPMRALNLINKMIMPIELLMFGFWVAVLCLSSQLYAVMPCLFFLVTYFKFQGWNLAYLPHRQSQFKFLYFLNDLYEDWLPLLAVIILVLGAEDWRMLLFVVIHLLLFKGLVFRLLNDVKLSVQNIRRGRISEQERIIIK